MSEFRDNKRDERIHRIAMKAREAGGLERLNAVASSVSADAMAMAVGPQWRAPEPRPEMGAHLGDVYGFAMSADDAEMVAAGYNPNDPAHCRAWSDRRRVVTPVREQVPPGPPGIAAAVAARVREVLGRVMPGDAPPRNEDK